MADPRMLRPCYRCLLRDMDKDAYFDQLQAYIDRMAAEEAPSVRTFRLLA